LVDETAEPSINDDYTMNPQQSNKMEINENDAEQVRKENLTMFKNSFKIKTKVMTDRNDAVLNSRNMKKKREYKTTQAAVTPSGLELDQCLISRDNSVTRKIINFNEMKNGRKERIQELRAKANSQLDIESDYFPKFKPRTICLDLQSSANSLSSRMSN